MEIETYLIHIKKVNSQKGKTMNKVDKLEQRKKHLERMRLLQKEDILYIPYKIRPIERKILINFEKISSKKLAKILGVNRSYIYAVVEKFKEIYTKEELK